MKSLALTLALGFCASGLTAIAADNSTTGVASAPPQASARSGGYWCRANNGSWVWVARPTDAGKATPAAKPADAKTARRVETYYRGPTAITTYPDADVRVINGINWYLNGRSYFSD